jgi:phosphatidylglycerol:prolipoprotein diacylglycerol transferase
MIQWNPDPDILSVGPLHVRWYGLMFLLGFSIGYAIIRWMCQIEKKKFEELEGLLVYVMAGTMIGARLGHVLFYAPGYYLSHPLEILKIWEGGLASHGGTLGVILGVWLYSRRYPQFTFMWMLDRLSIPTAMVASFIRIGNLMNSEIIGRPTDVPWSFVFLRIDNIPRHPGQLYESIAYFTLFIFTMTLYRLKPIRPPGFFIGIMLIWIFLSRIFLEHFKENQEAFEKGMFWNMGQLLSVPFVLAGIFLLVQALRVEKHRVKK